MADKTKAKMKALFKISALVLIIMATAFTSAVANGSVNVKKNKAKQESVEEETKVTKSWIMKRKRLIDFNDITAVSYTIDLHKTDKTKQTQSPKNGR